jgi:hypothetical protein
MPLPIFNWQPVTATTNTGVNADGPTGSTVEQEIPTCCTSSYGMQPPPTSEVKDPDTGMPLTYNIATIPSPFLPIINAIASPTVAARLDDIARSVGMPRDTYVDTVRQYAIWVAAGADTDEPFTQETMSTIFTQQLAEAGRVAPQEITNSIVAALVQGVDFTIKASYPSGKLPSGVDVTAALAQVSASPGREPLGQASVIDAGVGTLAASPTVATVTSQSFPTYVQPVRGDDPWHVQKKLITTNDQFSNWIDAVKKDLDNYAKKLRERLVAGEQVKNQLEIVERAIENLGAGTDLDNKKEIADKLLQDIKVVRVISSLWESGFWLYTALIQLILDGMVEGEPNIPWDGMIEILDFIIEGAKEVKGADTETLEAIKEVIKQLKELQEQMEKVKDASESDQFDLRQKIKEGLQSLLGE